MMLNLTPHPIKIMTLAGIVTIPPSGTVARVSACEEVVNHIDPVDDPHGHFAMSGGLGPQGDLAYVPVVSIRMGEVVGLPPPGTPCLVSSIVRMAVPNRPGVYSPDTGETAVRDANGQVIAVRRLIAA